MLDHVLAFIDLAFSNFDQRQPYVTFALLLIIVTALVANAISNRGLPRISGRIGRRATGAPAVTVPDGFARADCREITVFVATSDAGPYRTLKDFLRAGTARRPGRVNIYRVAGCHTRVEIPAGPPSYDRIDAAEALALLRELPDLRIVHRLHVRDEPSLLDPWVRKVTGRDLMCLGHATLTDLIVLCRPDRQRRREAGHTLLHEWLHLVAFRSASAVRRFRRADRIEPPLALPHDVVSFGDRRTPTFEAWSELGEKLLGYDEALARQTALASPVHSMILWRQIDTMLRKTPVRFASTRLDEFRARASFMRLEVAQLARAARARQRWWRRLWRYSLEAANSK
jgi:hypothetical protein